MKKAKATTSNFNEHLEEVFLLQLRVAEMEEALRSVSFELLRQSMVAISAVAGWSERER